MSSKQPRGGWGRRFPGFRWAAFLSLLILSPLYRAAWAAASEAAEPAAAPAGAVPAGAAAPAGAAPASATPPSPASKSAAPAASPAGSARNPVNPAPPSAPEAAAAGNPIRLASPIFVRLPGPTTVLPAEELNLRFVLIDVDGLPIRKAPISVNIDVGRVRRFEEVRPGLIEVDYQAPTESSSARSALQLRTVVNGRVVSQTYHIDVRPVQKGVLKLTLPGRPFKLGHDTEARVIFEGRTPQGRPIVPGDLDILTNIGRVERLKSVGVGKVEGRFLPGERRAPMAALIAGFIGEGTGQLVAWSTLQLVGTPEIPINTEPDATLWAEVGGSSYGPFKVGPTGAVRIPVNVPPGVRKVILRVQDSAGNTSTFSQDLSIPSFPRALLHVDRSSARIDERQPITLTLILIDEEGRPATLPSVPVTATGGRLGGLVESAPGTFMATYEPPDRPGPQELRLVLPLADGSESVYKSHIEVREGVPSRVELKVTPPVMRADDPPAEVVLHVLDKAGNPATGVRAQISATLGVVYPFRTVGPGEYVSQYRPPSTIEIDTPSGNGEVVVPLVVTLQRLGGKGTPAGLELSAPSRIVHCGGKALPVYARVLDRWGAPVSEARVSARIESGVGFVSEEQETDGEGRASFRYVPGRQVGPVVIVASVEGLPDQQWRILLLQSAIEPPLEAQGDSPLESGGVGGLGAPDLTARADVTLRAGRVKEIQITALPNVLYMDSRQSSEIRVRLEDGAGNVVVDPTIRLSASMGSIPGAPVFRDGYYVAHYNPPEANVPVAKARITVSNPQREYVGSTELQLLRRESKALGSVRLGAITNLGNLNSVSLSFVGMAQLPWKRPHLFVGFSLGYYYYGDTVEGETGSIRYDIFPIHLFGSYRRQIGRVTPFAGIGPILGLYSLRQDVTNLVGLVPPQAWGVLPGVGAMLGVEIGFGPGGIGVELDLSRFQGDSRLDGIINVDQNLGGLAAQVGYVAHF